MATKITRSAISVNAIRLGDNNAMRVVLPHMETIAERIKFARKRIRRITQEELTAECGWEYQSRISGYERGDREPGSDDLRLLAQALDISVAWLATGEGDPIASYSPVQHSRSIEASRLINAIDKLDAKGALPAWLFDAVETLLGNPMQTRGNKRASISDVKMPDFDEDAALMRKGLKDMEEQGRLLDEKEENQPAVKVKRKERET